MNARKTLVPAAVVGILLAISACGDLEADTGGTDVTTTQETSDQGAGETSKKKAKPKMSVEQEQAVEAAKSYLAMSSFSKAGLIDQLSSEYGDAFPREIAEFAVKHSGANWKAEAVEAAESYLEMTSFSRQGLIEQLTSEAGDQFTKKQAEHAVNQVGL